MITIDFPFFASMHERLKQPFNSKDYTLEQLNILYNSQNMLSNREFCSEEFAMAANLYFEEHKAELTKVVALNATSGDPLPAIIDKIIAEYPSLEDAMAYIETLNTTDRDGVVYVSLKTSEFSSFAMPAETFTKEITVAFEKASGTIVNPMKDLQNYYEAWLSDKTGYDAGMIIAMIDYLSEIINSANVIEELMISFGPQETAERLIEDIGNRLWLNKDSMEKAKSLANGEYQEFFAKMIEYKGFDGLRLLFQATCSSAQLVTFFATEGKDFSINNSAQADTLYNELSNLLSIVNYNIMDLNHLIGKLDIASFKELAKFYQMPQNIIEQLLTQELQDINSDDNVSTIFATKNFQLSIPYTKANGEQGTKNYTVELLPKSDPTALFVGKMTNCCQFYTGHSSKEAVIPVYKDPNAGLIVVKEQGKVKGASFVWLTQDNGLVLDSFEHLPEAQKAFLPFITELSKTIAKQSYKLYLGSGGKTPKLKDANNMDVKTQERAAPLSEGFMPYGDSDNVYLIKPNTQYNIDDNKEGNALTIIIESLNTEEKEQIKDIYKKFDHRLLEKIALASITIASKVKAASFIKLLKIMQPPTNDWQALDTTAKNLNYLNKILSNNFLKMLLLQNYESFPYALNNIRDEYLPGLNTIWAYSKERCQNLVDNLKILTPDQIKKTLSNSFLKELLKENHELLQYALDNIIDEYLPRLNAMWIYSKEEIKNLADNLKILTPEQAEKTLSNNFLKELLKQNTELLQYALDNIKDEDLPKLNYVGIFPHNENELKNLVSNLKILTTDQLDKTLANNFFKNLITQNPELLEYALANIKDQDLPELKAISVDSKEEIDNLTSHIKTLNTKQFDKALANKFLQNLLTKSPELLEYALDNIKDEDLPKLNYVWAYSKEDIENLVNNLDKLTPEQAEKVISTHSITQSYDLIKDQLTPPKESTKVMGDSESKEINGFVAYSQAELNILQEAAESKVTGDNVDFIADFQS